MKITSNSDYACPQIRHRLLTKSIPKPAKPFEDILAVNEDIISSITENLSLNVIPLQTNENCPSLETVLSCSNVSANNNNEATIRFSSQRSVEDNNCSSFNKHAYCKPVR